MNEEAVKALLFALVAAGVLLKIWRILVVLVGLALLTCLVAGLAQIVSWFHSLS